MFGQQKGRNIPPSQMTYVEARYAQRYFVETMQQFIKNVDAIKTLIDTRIPQVRRIPSIGNSWTKFAIARYDCKSATSHLHASVVPFSDHNIFFILSLLILL